KKGEPGHSGLLLVVWGRRGARRPAGPQRGFPRSHSVARDQRPASFAAFSFTKRRISSTSARLAIVTTTRSPAADRRTTVPSSRPPQDLLPSFDTISGSPHIVEGRQQVL